MTEQMKTGIGYSGLNGSYAAAAEAATHALASANQTTCDVVLVFATGRHDAEQIRAGLRSVVGIHPRIAGGSAGGIITNAWLRYEGCEVGVATISLGRARADIFVAEGLSDAEFACGVSLAEQINAAGLQESSNILLLYDSVKRTAEAGQPALHLATPIIDGMRSAIPALPPFAGIGVMADGSLMTKSALWHHDHVTANAALALVLSDQVQMDTTILHGCRPATAYHTITKADGPVIFEIDHRPALDVICDLLSADTPIDPDSLPMFLTLGVNRGNKFDEFREENYANRLCLAVDKEHRAIVMFEPDLQAGASIQIMQRSIDVQYIEQNIAALFARLEARKPVFALYLDCIGRCKAFCGMDVEEAAEVQRVIGDRVPLLGVYSGVEIARVGAEVQALDWTGVLCVFSVPE